MRENIEDDGYDNFFDLSTGSKLKDVLEESYSNTSISLSSSDVDCNHPESKKLRESPLKSDENFPEVINEDDYHPELKKVVVIDSESDEKCTTIGSLTPPPEIPKKFLQEIGEISKVLKKKGDELKPVLDETFCRPNYVDELPYIPKETPLSCDLANEKKVYERSIVKIEMRFLSWKKNKRLSKPARIRLLSTSTFENMIASVCKRRKFNESEVVFLYKKTELFKHGTPDSVRMSKEAEIEVMLRDDYLDKRMCELKRIEIRAEKSSLDGPYVKIKISSAQETSSFTFLRTTTIKDVILSSFIPSINEKKDLLKRTLHFDGEYLNPESRLCDFEIDDGDILELHWS